MDKLMLVGRNAFDVIMEQAVKVLTRHARRPVFGPGRRGLYTYHKRLHTTGEPAPFTGSRQQTRRADIIGCKKYASQRFGDRRAWRQVRAAARLMLERRARAATQAQAA